MVVTLTGGNAFGLQQELHKIVQTFRDEHGDFGLERLEVADAPVGRLLETISALPFLASKRLLIMRELSANKPAAEAIKDILEAVPEQVDVVIVEPKLDKRLNLYKTLKAQTDYREFNELDEAGLSRWLVATVQERGGTLSSPDAAHLIRRVGANQQLLSNEIEKLFTYNPTVTRESIDLLTEPSPQSSIFDVLDAAFAGDGGRALALYSEQRAQKVEPQQVLAMIIWQIHALALVKTAGKRSPEQIAREAGLSPFVVRKTMQLAAKRSLEEVRALVDRLFKLDIELKTTPIDADEALQHLLITL
jgi:DNA polymerase-3 subunit delta